MVGSVGAGVMYQCLTQSVIVTPPDQVFVCSSRLTLDHAKED